MQGNFAPPPPTTQPPLRSFVPTETPMLRNLEQYQQPTLGSQLYPVCSLHMLGVTFYETIKFLNLHWKMISGGF